MNELLFIRHAETHLAGTFCGHSDPPLNARGQRQLEALVDNLPLPDFDAVYTSDLQRARATAERIATSLQVPLNETSDLREIYFGDWEGLSWEQIEQRDTTFASRWAAEFPALSAPGGERYEEFKQRVLRMTAQLRSFDNIGRIVVVTHGGVMRLVLTELCGKSHEEAWAITKPYCSSFLYAPATLSVEVCA